MNSDLMKGIVCASLSFFLLTLAFITEAQTLDFDSLRSGYDTPVANGYGGLSWPGFLLRPGSFYSPGMVSPFNVAVGTSYSYIYSGNLFDFVSAFLTAKDSNGTHVRVQGLAGTNLLYDNAYVIQTNGPTYIQFNYFAINQAKFLLTNSAFVMDDVEAKIDCASVCKNYVIAWGSISLDCPFPSNVLAMAAGYGHALFLKEDNTVAGCGFYYAGTNPPITLPDGLTNIIAVSAGDSHSMALKTDGTVLAWGINTFGQTDVPPGLTNVIAIAAGAQHSLALKEDGSVVGWGGSGGAVVPEGISNVVAIAAGRGSSLALKADGTVRAWGAGNTNFAGLSNIVAISGGPNCCGYSWDALQDNGKVSIGNPSGIVTTSSNIVAISLSRGTDGTVSLWLLSDGTVLGAGYLWDGSVGGGQPVPPGLPKAGAIAAGDYVFLAMITNGPPAGPILLGLGKDTNGFNLSLSTQSGRVYRLEYKNAIDETDWVALPLVAGNGRVRRLWDSTAPAQQRFYRVRNW